MRLPFVRYSSGGLEYRGLRYFLPRDFKAWPTHEVTIARTFVHLFCTWLPTSSEKRRLGEAFRHLKTLANAEACLHSIREQ
jgi:hypothetical protein